MKNRYLFGIAFTASMGFVTGDLWWLAGSAAFTAAGLVTGRKRGQR